MLTFYESHRSATKSARRALRGHAIVALHRQAGRMWWCGRLFLGLQKRPGAKEREVHTEGTSHTRDALFGTHTHTRARARDVPFVVGEGGGALLVALLLLPGAPYLASVARGTSTATPTLMYAFYNWGAGFGFLLFLPPARNWEKGIGGGYLHLHIIVYSCFFVFFLRSVSLLLLLLWLRVGGAYLVF